jgi:pimeloyl-ACP methyl ester carboxylesterase
MTSTPAGLQDTIPGIARKLLKNVPQSLFRQSMIVFDKMESIKNENYKNLSHKQFKTDEGYQPYAQFGGMKIPNLKNVINWIEQAPRLDDYSHKITKPSLFIYGGNDSMLGIKDCALPEKIEKLYNQVSSKKGLIISPEADHSLNTSTKTDDCFNQDIKYFPIKLEITKHFLNTLL